MLRDWWAAVRGGFIPAAIAALTLRLNGTAAGGYLKPVGAYWILGALVTATFLAWRSEYRAALAARAEAVAAVAELATEKDRRPKLSPTITHAADVKGEEINSCIAFLNVQVVNTGSDSVKLLNTEVRIELDGTEHIGRSFQIPGSRCDYDRGNKRRLSVSRGDLLEERGAIGGRDAIGGIVCAMFYDLPYADFSDVVLKVRVQGIGCDWSEWHAFQPPKEALVPMSEAQAISAVHAAMLSVDPSCGTDRMGGAAVRVDQRGDRFDVRLLGAGRLFAEHTDAIRSALGTRLGTLTGD